jgi:hypothetical protein
LGVFLAFADAFWAFAEAFWARAAALSSLAAEWFLLWRATAFAISSEESLLWFSECKTSVWSELVAIENDLLCRPAARIGNPVRACSNVWRVHRVD